MHVGLQPRHLLIYETERYILLHVMSWGSLLRTSSFDELFVYIFLLSKKSPKLLRIIMTTIIQFLWQYFYRNETKYKTNQTNKAAWCKACLKGHMCVLAESDAVKTRAGQLLAVRSQEDLQKSGLSLKLKIQRKEDLHEI